MKKYLAALIAIGLVTTPVYAAELIEDTGDVLMYEDSVLLEDNTESLINEQKPSVDESLADENTGKDTSAEDEETSKYGDLLPMPARPDAGGMFNNDRGSSDEERPKSCLGPDTRLSTTEKEYVINRVNQIVSTIISDDMDDIEKYWRLAEWVKDNTTLPDLDTDWYADHRMASDTPHGSYGALKNGIAMPQGQVLLYSKLCHAAGLPCDELIDDTGSIYETAHVVNLLPNINGNAYIVDIFNDRFLASPNAFYKFGRESFETQFIYNRQIVKSYTYEDRFPLSGTTGKNDFTGKLYYRHFTPGLWNVYKSYEMYQSDPVTYKNLMGEGYWHDSMLTCSYSKEVKEDGNYRFTWAEEPYLEKGSGTDGQKVASYSDYLGENETGNWTVDDFYANPKDRYPKITNATVTGLKSSYEFYDDSKIAEYIEIIKKDISLTLDGKQLILDTDYRIKSMVLNDSTATINIIGINDYAGGIDVTINTTRPLPHKAIELTVYEYDSIRNNEIAKTNSDKTYTIDIQDRSIADILADGTVKGIKEGTTTATITKESVIYDLTVIVKGKENISRDIVILQGGKALYSEIIKDKNDKTYAITYTNKNIANIDKKGYVNGKKAGGTNATIKTKNVIYTYNIKVINPAYESKTFYKNTGDEFNVNLKADGALLSGYFPVTYTSSKPNIATIDADGNVKALSKGSTTIKANVQNRTYSVKIEVYNPTLTGTDSLLINNKTQTLKVSNGRGTTTWTSSDPAVVTVDSKGKIKAVSKGTAIITAVNNGRVMEHEVKTYNVPRFEKKEYVTSINEPVLVELIKDEDMDGVVYTVNNSKNATIDSAGLVTPIKKSTVTVSAKVAGVTYKVKVKIQ